MSVMTDVTVFDRKWVFLFLTSPGIVTGILEKLDMHCVCGMLQLFKLGHTILRSAMTGLLSQTYWR